MDVSIGVGTQIALELESSRNIDAGAITGGGLHTVVTQTYRAIP